MLRLSVEQAVAAVRQDLNRRVAGRCYEASEAIYHLAGGRRAGLTPMQLRVPFPRTGDTLFSESHWFLRGPRGERIDVTGGQYRPRLSASLYATARGRGFLTRKPSARARAIMRRVGTYLALALSKRWR